MIDNKLETTYIYIYIIFWAIEIHLFSLQVVNCLNSKLNIRFSVENCLGSETVSASGKIELVKSGCKRHDKQNIGRGGGNGSLRS